MKNTRSNSVYKVYSLFVVALSCSLSVVSAQTAPPAPSAPPPPPPPAAPPPPPTVVTPTAPSNSSYGQNVPTPQAPPAPPPLPYVQTYDAANPPDAILDPNQAPARGPWGQAALQFGLPIFLSTPGRSVNLGYSFLGRFGLHMGNIVPELQLGFMRNDYENTFGYGETLKNTFFGLGVRAILPTASIVSPFVAAHLNFNWWDVDYFNSKFAPGFDAEAGLLFHVHPIVAIEASARLGQSFSASGYFSDAQFWLSPQIGVTFFFY